MPEDRGHLKIAVTKFNTSRICEKNELNSGEAPAIL